MPQAHFNAVDLPARAFSEYEQFNESLYVDVREAARELAGVRVLHINSASEGGGVAELLKSQIPLEVDLGLASRWLTLKPADEAFFSATVKLHNLLQGADIAFTDEDMQLYEQESAALRDALAERIKDNPPDIIVSHDPQPLLTVAELDTSAVKILRVHVDLCAPNEWALDFLCRHVDSFDHVIISRQDCSAACLPRAKTDAITPAIDPLAAKNQALETGRARTILRTHGIDTSRPLITQISRFDEWKDQLGVLEAYKQAKEDIPGLQLMFVGFFRAEDDPDAMEYFDKVRAASAADADVHLFSRLTQLEDGVGNDEFVNAAQTASDIILQKSIREGFGLTATEAMWKGKPVIGGDAGGILLQIRHGENGFIAHNADEAANQIVTLIRDPQLAAQMGKKAKQSVRERHLLPEFLLEHLEVYTRYANTST